MPKKAYHPAKRWCLSKMLVDDQYDIVYFLIIVTYLWCVLRTHGKADATDVATMRFVSTPNTNITSWFDLCWMKIRVTLKMSQRKPDVAQPE
jgi:hypothetical protein